MKTVKILFLFFLLITGFYKCFSQEKVVEVTIIGSTEEADSVRGHTKKVERPLDNVYIYGFYDFAKAQALYKKFKDNNGYKPTDRDYNKMSMTAIDGRGEVTLPGDGYIVIMPPFGNAIHPEYVKNRRQILLKIKNEGIQMNVLDVKKKKNRANRPRQGIQVGDTKIIGPYSFYLSEEDTRSNARVVLAPLATILETGDTFKIVRPFVKDGKAYQATQFRRMGFDNLRDPLIASRSKYFMQTREEDSITVFEVLHPIKQNYHYKMTAQLWFEDYNTVYRLDSVCIDEGFSREPMRFLDFKLDNVDIDHIRYERRGTREVISDKRKLDLNFLVGEAKLDPTDSIGFGQLNQLKLDLGRFVNDAESEITFAQIVGQASPEGGYAINERLCRQRSEYLRTEVSSLFPRVKIESKVASWLQVAELLEQDSLLDYANQVREIVAATQNFRTQEVKIKQLSCYEYIKEKVLPRLRVVEFTFNYETHRVLSREEVYERYENRADYRNATAPIKPYEYYYLFDKLKKSPKELEVLARNAHRQVKDPNSEKPWPLAAYYLAQCYLHRDTCDTTLLKPYLDWYSLPNQEKKDFDGFTLGWVNDEAIVATHIAMLCKAGSYVMADSIAVNLLPDVPKFKRLKLFLNCLNFGWNNSEVRDTVALSSPFNKAVVYAAQDGGDDDKGFHQAALNILQDSTQVDFKDPRVFYLTAILRFRLECEYPDNKFSDSNFQFDEFYDEMYGPREDWGCPMIECCQRAEKYVKMLQYDGYFNKNYRTAFNAYWNKLKGILQEKTGTKQKIVE